MRWPRLTLTTALLATVLGPAPVTAQHATHEGRPPGAAREPGGGHSIVQTYETELEKVVGEGRGFGMAFAADRNGYPGPIHVLELRDRLALTPGQEATARELLARMFAASRPKGQGFLAAERRLAALFASGAADEGRVRAAVAEVERLRAELRLVHLLAHLEMRALLTDEQRREYHAARWGAR